jgi:outer membrane protein assembly factor BamB
VLVIVASLATGAEQGGSRPATPPPAAASAKAGGWLQWGGPNRNFTSDATGLASKWPDAGPRTIWSRPLGTGHSAILADEGRLFTMYRAGNGRTRGGPFQPEESVIAIDAATGKTLWEHKYPSKLEDFSFGAGPHSTPLIVGDRLFTAGTNKQIFAFDKKTGKVLWSHDLVAEFNAPPLLIRPVVKVGYGCSFIAYRDTIICSVGGPGQSVMAFRQSDGAVVWRSGHFLISDAAPILIDVGGQDQVVFLGGGTVTGLDPSNGSVLWSHPHDPGNDLNCGTPLWGRDGILFVSSAYKAGSRAIRLTRQGDATRAEEMWFTNRVRFMFLSAIRLGDYVYGTTGDFGPAFLTALDIRTGQAAWQHRGFGRASLIYADGKAIVMDEDGDLALATLTPEGVTVLSQARVFETVSWTVPTLEGTTLYARDREKIVALDLGEKRLRPERGAEAPSERGLVAAPALGALAQTPDLSGTWQLSTERSRIAAAAGLAGLVSVGAPEALHITQAANGTVAIESRINESHARLYKPGVEIVTPVTVGAAGTITMTSRWERRTLVSEGRRESASGPSTMVRQVKEVIGLSADGRTLTIDITARRLEETSTSSLVYTRALDAGSCKTWPTPCKLLP